MKNSTVRLLGLLAVAAVSASADNLFFSDGTNLYTVDDSSLNTLNTVALNYGSGSGSFARTLDSLAYDPANGLLYANASGSLESIDPFSGLVTILPGTGLDSSVQLAFDANGNLYGLDSDTSQFLSVSPLTGNASFLSNANDHSVDLAFNPTTDTFETFGGSGSGSGLQVNQVDPLSGDLLTLFYAGEGNATPSTFTIDGAGTIFAVCSAGSGSRASGATVCDSTFLSIDPSGKITQLSQFDAEGDVVAAGPSFAPEPSAVILLLSGGAGLFAFRKKLLR